MINFINQTENWGESTTVTYTMCVYTHTHTHTHRV